MGLFVGCHMGAWPSHSGPARGRAANRLICEPGDSADDELGGGNVLARVHAGEAPAALQARLRHRLPLVASVSGAGIRGSSPCTSDPR